MSPIFSRHPRGELSAYVDAQVTDSERQAIETHLASCDPCRLEVDDLREVRSALAALPKVAAPRSFAITAEMVAPPAAAPVDHLAPSFTSGLRMASAAIGVALIAVVLVDAGNFSATDDDGDTGSIDDNRVETQADSDFEASQGADSAAGAADEAAVEPAEDAGEAESSAGGVGGTGPAPDGGEAEDGGDDSAGTDIAAAPIPTEPASDESVDDSSARFAEPTREPYGLFPGQFPPPGYVYSPPRPANGTIGGFATGSGMSSADDEAEAAPEATDAAAPTAPDAAPAPEATAGDDALTGETTENDDGEDGAEDPNAAGEDAAQPLTDNDSGGLSTLNVVEIALAVGLALAIIGGFVLPRVRRTTS